MPEMSPERLNNDPKQRAPADEPGLQSKAAPNLASQAAPDFASSYTPPPAREKPQQTGPADEPQRVPLTQQGRTRLSILITRTPWELDVDAFVIPAGARAGLRGRLAQSWLSALGPVGEKGFRAALSEAMATQGFNTIAPGAPLLLRLPDEARRAAKPGYAVLATAYASDQAKADLISAGKAAGAVLRLAAANGLRRLALPLLGSGTGGLDSVEVARTMVRSILETPRSPELAEVTLITLVPDSITAAQQAVADLLRQRLSDLSNDLARGEDLLNIEGEVSALAEGLLLRDLNPPLVVGILGGWGSGKSFVMHLMHERMAAIRSEPIPEAGSTPAPTNETPPAFPYVGHVYLIKFDAWTYAKSNLWASLMQSIFYELNQQLTLEKTLREKGLDDRKGGAVWRILFDMDDKQRERFLADPLVGEVLQQLQEQEASADLLWTTLRDLKQQERKTLHDLEAKLAGKRQELEAARQALQQAVDAGIEREARAQAWLPLERVLQAALGKTLDRFKAQVTAAAPAEGPLDAAAAPAHALAPSLRDLARLAAQNWVEAAAFLAFFAATLVTPWVLQQLERFRYPGGALAVGALLVEGWRTQQKWQRLLTESWVAYQQQVREARDKLAAERPHRLQERLEAQTAEARSVQDDEAQLQQLNTVPALELQVQKLEGQALRQRQRVGLTAETVSLADFVSTRLNAADYEKELGLMHQVQRDLRELAYGLAGQPRDGEPPQAPSGVEAAAATADEQRRQAEIRQSLFPRGPARIVLFIDDLDRCPPDKVVEVLEATQLLVKTPLFVVILAMDVRFISRALEERYARILMRKGRPSGLDYIEKIIQIPYQVRSIETGALPRYLQSLMRPSARPGARPATGPSPRPEAGDSGARGHTAGGADLEGPSARPAGGILPDRVLSFSEAEYEFLQRCCAHIDLTPRAIKRLVNVYRLIKIIWARPNPVHQPPWPVEQGMLVLLALAGRYPDQMRELLEALQPKLEGGEASTFAEFFAQHVLPEGDPYARREWDRLLEDVRALMPAEPEPLRLSQMPIDNFNLVRSFSFVGDIGYQPGDYPAQANAGTAGAGRVAASSKASKRGGPGGRAGSSR